MGRGLASQHFFLNLVLLYVVCWISTVVFLFVFGEVPRSSLWKSRYHLSGSFVRHKSWNTQNTQNAWGEVETGASTRCLGGAYPSLGELSRLRDDSFKYWWILHHLGYSDLKPMSFDYQLSKVGRGPYISNMSRWKPQELPTILSQPQIGLRACTRLEQ